MNPIHVHGIIPGFQLLTVNYDKYLLIRCKLRERFSKLPTIIHIT